LPLTLMAQSFGPAEYFALMVLGLVAAVIFSQGSPVKSVAMIFVGLLFGLVGADVNTGVDRYTFGLPELRDGIGFVVVSMGVFGIAEIIANLGQPERRGDMAGSVSRLWLSWDEFRAAWPAALRGTAIGSLLGVLPGGGAMLGSFASYAVEKRVAREPGRFGNG